MVESSVWLKRRDCIVLFSGCVADAKPSSCHSEKHRLDFLDLLDAASVTKTSPVDQPKSRDSSDWLMSAERPRLFPRKLY